MALTTRTKAVLSSLGAVSLVGVAAVGYLLFTGSGDAIPFLGGSRDEPVICPLTGEEAANERAARRTPVAVKVENISESRPQAGLEAADVVFEEPVEGGITRFVAVFHCEAATRVGPVRSARFVDPDILVQFGEPVFAYSGGVQQVVEQVAKSGAIQDLSQNQAADLYAADPNRSAPHNLYVSTSDLLSEAGKRGVKPDPLFEYEEEPPGRPGSRRARQINLDFSPEADVLWQYRGQRGVYVRSHGETPHALEDGSQVSSTNVVVLVVELRETGIIDAAGNPSPDVQIIGSGPAYVFRNGRVVQGRWVREGMAGMTQLLDRGGDVIPLAPGRTWVELFPSDLAVEFS